MTATIPFAQLQTLNLTFVQGSTLELTVPVKDAAGANIDLTVMSGAGPYSASFNINPLAADQAISPQGEGMVVHNGSVSILAALTSLPIGTYPCSVHVSGSDNIDHVIGRGVLQVVRA